MPGKLLWKLDPGAIDRLAARLRARLGADLGDERQDDDGGDGGRDPRPRHPPRAQRAGANLVSGVASTLLAAGGAELGLFEVDEAALPEVAPPASARAPSASATSSATSSTATASSSSSPSAGARRSRALPASRRSSSTPTTRWSATSPSRARRGVVFGLDDPRSGAARRSSTRPTRSTASAAARRTSTRRPTSATSATTAARAAATRVPPLDVAAREIELGGLEASAFDLVTPAGHARVGLRLPGLYNVYNALAAAALDARARRVARRDRGGLERSAPAFGRFERIEIGDRSAAHAADQEPGRRERGRADARRRRRPPTLAVVALNDAIADGRDVSWIWDVDFEPLLGGLERLVATGERAAELALRFTYGGFAAERDRGRPRPRARRSTAGSSSRRAGGELVVLPTYTAMLALRRIVAERGHVRPYWERAA